MRIKFSIIFCMLSVYFVSDQLVAQNNFTSGYIISNTNDTIRGYIQQFTSGSTICYFKKNPEGTAIAYSPVDISAYRFDDNGKFFVSKETPLESGNKMLFLEFLIKGKASIYFMRDNMEHYFIETEKDKLSELSESQKIIENSNGVKWIKQPRYKGKLKYILSDCPEIASKIETLSLQPKELINLAKDYHEKVCDSEQCIVFERKSKPVKIRTRIEAGVGFSQFRNQITHTNFSPGALIACKFDFENLLFSAEQTTFQTGLILQHYSNYTRYRDGHNSWVWNYVKDTTNVTLNTLAIKIPLIVNYTFPLGKVKPYIGGGIMNSFAKSSSTEIIRKFPLYQIGLVGMTGVSYTLNNSHKLNIGLSFEYNIDLVDIDFFYSLRSRNLSIVLGYEL